MSFHDLGKKIKDGLRRNDLGMPEGASIQGMKDYIYRGIEMDRICGNGAIGSLQAYDVEEELNRYLKYLKNNNVE